MGTVTPDQLNSLSHAVNTTGKTAGTEAFLEVPGRNPRPVWASGSAPSAPWHYADGAVAEIPNSA